MSQVKKNKGVKEFFRRKIVSLKRKPQTIPMIVLAIGVVLCGVLAQPITNVVTAAAAAIL